MTEQTLVSVEAMVMNFDASTGQWMEMGSISGTATLVILKSISNEYRYVAMKAQNAEILINTYLSLEFKYTESTENFHMLCQPDGLVIGLNFLDTAEAKRFAATIQVAMEHLEAIQNPPSRQPEAPPLPKANLPMPEVATDTLKSRKKSRPTINAAPTTPVPQTNASATAVKIKPTQPPPSSGSAGAPPPPGPPPPAPAPPGPPPPAPSSVAKPTPSVGAAPAPANDFASQLRLAAQKPRNVVVAADNSGPDTGAASGTTASGSESAASAAAPTDFLSEMRNKLNKKRTQSPALGMGPASTSPVTGRVTPDSISTSVGPSVTAAVGRRSSLKSGFLQTSELASGKSSMKTNSNYVTSEELEKFRKDIMKDLVAHMDRIRDEIISQISAKLNL